MDGFLVFLCCGVKMCAAIQKMENGCFQRDESVRHNSETIDVNRTKGVSYERVRNYVDFATSGWPHSQLLGKLEDEES